MAKQRRLPPLDILPWSSRHLLAPALLPTNEKRSQKGMSADENEVIELIDSPNDEKKAPSPHVYVSTATQTEPSTARKLAFLDRFPEVADLLESLALHTSSDQMEATMGVDENHPQSPTTLQQDRGKAKDAPRTAPFTSRNSGRQVYSNNMPMAIEPKVALKSAQVDQENIVGWASGQKVTSNKAGRSVDEQMQSNGPAANGQASSPVDLWLTTKRPTRQGVPLFPSGRRSSSGIEPSSFASSSQSRPTLTEELRNEESSRRNPKPQTSTSARLIRSSRSNNGLNTTTSITSFNAEDDIIREDDVWEEAEMRGETIPMDFVDESQEGNQSNSSAVDGPIDVYIDNSESDDSQSDGGSDLEDLADRADFPNVETNVENPTNWSPCRSSIEETIHRSLSSMENFLRDNGYMDASVGPHEGRRPKKGEGHQFEKDMTKIILHILRCDGTPLYNRIAAKSKHLYSVVARYLIPWFDPLFVQMWKKREWSNEDLQRLVEPGTLVERNGKQRTWFLNIHSKREERIRLYVLLWEMKNELDKIYGTHTGQSRDLSSCFRDHMNGLQSRSNDLPMYRKYNVLQACHICVMRDLPPREDLWTSFLLVVGQSAIIWGLKTYTKRLEQETQRFLGRPEH